MIVIISDGQYYIQGMVYPNLNDIDDGIIVNDIIRIKDYRMESQDGMPICNILSYQIFDTNIKETIGSPVNISSLLIQLETEREDLERQREAEREDLERQREALVAEANADAAMLLLVAETNADAATLVTEANQMLDAAALVLVQEQRVSAEREETERANSSRLSISSNMSSSLASVDNCVICQVTASSQAIIPCGHYCLCDDCATTLTIGPSESKLCPLCRTPIQSYLKIYQSKSS